METENSKINNLLAWQTTEHPHLGKDPDWVWSVVVISCGISFGALFFKNYLLAILIVFAAAALIIKGRIEPKPLTVYITELGIVLDKELFPYEKIESFWIKETGNRKLLILRMSALMSPVIQIPLAETKPEDVRDILAQIIPELFHHKSLVDRAIELIGF